MVPPSSLPAEQAAIGSALLDADAAEAVAALPVEAWYREAHRIIAETIQQLGVLKQPVDLVTMCNRMTANGTLDAAGGMDYLATMMEQVPSPSSYATYTAMIERAYKLRQLIGVADRVLRDAYAADIADADALVTLAEERILALGRATVETQVAGIGALAAKAYRDIDAIARRAREDDGLTMPFESLRGMVRRLRKGHIAFVAARTGVGKTAFAMNLALGWAQQGHAGIFFSLEMNARDIATRAMLSLSHPVIERDEVDDPEVLQADCDRIMAGLSRATVSLRDLPLMVDDRPHITPTVIAATIRRQRSRGHNIRFAVVDYSQLIDPTTPMKGRTRAQEVASVIRDLAGIAKEYGITIVALTQVNREAEGRTDSAQPKRPELHQMAESSGIENYAHLVLSLYWPAHYGRQECERSGYPDPEYYPGIVEVNVLKQREGRGRGRAALWFDGGCCRYRSLSGPEAAALKVSLDEHRRRVGNYRKKKEED
jgi:replicative DNA helicase